MKRLKSLYPHVLIGILFSLIVLILVSSNNIYVWLQMLWPFTLLQMTGLGKFGLNNPTWYLSAMLLGMLVLYPLLRKYKDTYSKLIAPIIVIFLSGIMYHNYGNLHSWSFWLGWCYKGTLFGFLSLNIGIIVYELCEKMKKIRFTFFARLLLTVIEIGLLVTVILMQHFLIKASLLDYFWLICFAISILIAFSEKTLEYPFCCNKFFYYLERLSLPIYLNQNAVILIISKCNYFSRFNYFQNMLLCVIITLIISVITLKLVDLWNHHKQKLGKCFKKILIEE